MATVGSVADTGMKFLIVVSVALTTVPGSGIAGGHFEDVSKGSKDLEEGGWCVESSLSKQCTTVSIRDGRGACEEC